MAAWITRSIANVNRSSPSNTKLDWLTLAKKVGGICGSTKTRQSLQTISQGTLGMFGNSR